MLVSRQLASALKRVPLTTYEGHLCRTVSAAALFGRGKRGGYKPRPLYDLGPGASGARFTPKRGARALYLADDYETSIREYLQVGVPGPLQPGASAFVTYSAKVRLDLVLDLTDRRVLERLGTTSAELGQPWRYRRDRRTPPAHVLGRAVAATGRIQAIRFASTKGRGVCFAVLTTALVFPAFVEIRDSDSNLVERLP